MSFSSDVKAELCRTEFERVCCARAEAYGVLLWCNTFTPLEVRIITESESFAGRLPKLLMQAFGLTFDRLPGAGEQKYVFQITDAGKIGKIIDAFGFDSRQNPVMHINFGVLEEGCCRAAFLRGAFWLEEVSRSPASGIIWSWQRAMLRASRELLALLGDMEYQPKETVRSGSRVIYFKSSGQIEDLLTLMGAPLKAMELMNTRAEKELRNGVNRRVNCEAANLDKAVDAAQEQLQAIRRLYEMERVEGLPFQLKETIVLRETYPELTLSQLAEEFDPPITKSCLNHRLRKLVEMSKQ